MTKVLCLLSDYEGNGGIHRFNRNLVMALTQHSDFKNKVLTLNDRSCSVVYQGFTGNKPAFALAAAREVKKFKPDVLMIGLLNFAPLAFLKKLCSCKVVIILHGFEAWRRRSGLQPFYRWVDSFWAVSEHTKKSFSKTNAVPLKKIEKIFNTIPSSWENPGRSVGYGSYFLSVSRLDKGEKYKGIDKTIEALSFLKEEMKKAGWEYRLVAWGDDLHRHRELVARHGLGDLVKFYSNLSDDELKDLYAGCSFFSLPSTGEGFGIVFLEAMAHKKACVGASGCGTEDVIIHEETGFLIEPTVGNIEQCLRRLISEPALCKEMGDAGYEKLRSDFSFPQFQTRITGLLNVREASLPSRAASSVL